MVFVLIQLKSDKQLIYIHSNSIYLSTNTLKNCTVVIILYKVIRVSKASKIHCTRPFKWVITVWIGKKNTNIHENIEIKRRMEKKYMNAH